MGAISVKPRISNGGWRAIGFATLFGIPWWIGIERIIEWIM